MFNFITKDTIKYYYLLFLGSVIVSLILYFRVFITRFPRELYFITIDHQEQFITINLGLLTLNLVSICISFCIFIYNVKLIYFNNIKIQNRFIIYISSKLMLIINTIQEALETIYEFIMQKIPNNYNLGKKLFIAFYNLFCKNLNIFIIFYFTWSIIICIIFMIDIYWFFRLNYFYKSLILLIIPLLCNLILFMLKNWTLNKHTIEEYVVMEHYHVGTVNEKHVFKIKEQYKNSVHYENLPYLISEYRIYLILEPFIKDLELIKSHFAIRVNIFIYFNYFFGWFYIFLSNLQLFFNFFFL